MLRSTSNDLFAFFSLSYLYLLLAVDHRVYHYSVLLNARVYTTRGHCNILRPTTITAHFSIYIYLYIFQLDLLADVFDFWVKCINRRACNGFENRYKHIYCQPHSPRILGKWIRNLLLNSLVYTSSCFATLLLLLFVFFFFICFLYYCCRNGWPQNGWGCARLHHSEHTKHTQSTHHHRNKNSNKKPRTHFDYWIFK